MPQEWKTERALHVLLPLLLLLLQAAAALEDLDSYPHEPEVHAYLLDRLTRVAGLEALYELHYLAITLGKVKHAALRLFCNVCRLQPSTLGKVRTVQAGSWLE
jgi:hypothetical protein